MIEFLQHIDTEIFLSLNRLHAPFWDYFMSTYSGKLIWIPMYATIVYILFRNLHWKVALCYAIGIIIAIAIADSVCARIIRPYTERLRPANLANPISGLVHIVDNYRGGAYGFPSCHAANSFALAMFLIGLFKNKALTIFIILWAFINSYSRLYIGVHYTGDLIAGAAIGLLSGWIMYLTAKKFSQRILLTYPPIFKFRQTSILIYTGTITAICILIYATVKTMF